MILTSGVVPNLAVWEPPFASEGQNMDIKGGQRKDGKNNKF